MLPHDVHGKHLGQAQTTRGMSLLEGCPLLLFEELAQMCRNYEREAQALVGMHKG